MQQTSFKLLSHYPFEEREMKITSITARLLTAYLGMMLVLRGVQAWNSFYCGRLKYVLLKFTAKVLQQTPYF